MILKIAVVGDSIHFVKPSDDKQVISFDQSFLAKNYFD